MKKIRKKETAARFLRQAAAASLAGCVLLAGGVQAKAATMQDVFDEQYYADQYPDLKAVFGYDRAALYNHFTAYGLAEGRIMSSLIDVVKYRNLYPDLNSAFGDNWDAYVDHYVAMGAKEGRDAGTGFDALAYAARYEDLKEAFGDNVLALWNHYKALGSQEGRDASPAGVGTPTPGAGTAAQPADPAETQQPVTPSAPAQSAFVQKGSVIDSGKYMGLDWQVTDANELIVTGHMEGEGLENGETIWADAPWCVAYRGQITTAVLSFTGAKTLQGFFAGTHVNFYGLQAFSGWYELSEVYLGGLDTSNVTDMSKMFYECLSLKTLDLSSFDTRNVTDMSSMFSGCSELQSINLGNFDTSNVTDMSSMFWDCSELQSIDLSNFNTSKVTNMRQMFWDCYGLQPLDLSSFDTRNVTNMEAMLEGCGNTLGIFIGDGWKIPDGTNPEDVFSGPAPTLLHK